MLKHISILSPAFILICLTTFAADQPPRAATPAFKNEVSITLEGDSRIIRSNGIPDHPTGQFPGRGNPNAISPQQYEYRIPANPKIADKTTALRMQPFGIAVNGIVFDPGAAEWWNGDRNSGWQYEPLAMAPLFMGTDTSHAHVQPNGAYHYHGTPNLLINALTGGAQKMVIIGWAADGFPIYNSLGHTDPKDTNSPLKPLKSSYRIKQGNRSGGPGGPYDGLFLADYEYISGLGDLDECHGRFEVTPEYPAGIYHYAVTDQFPFIPRMYRGTPDPSFNRRGPGGGAGGPPRAGDGGPGFGRGRGGQGGGPGFGGQGGRGGSPDASGPVRLLPRFADETLKLTDDQKKQIADLEKDAADKLEKILTPDQLKTLREARQQRGPGGGGGPAQQPGVGRPSDNP